MQLHCSIFSRYTYILKEYTYKYIYKGPDEKTYISINLFLSSYSDELFCLFFLSGPYTHNTGFGWSGTCWKTCIFFIEDPAIGIQFTMYRTHCFASADCHTCPILANFELPILTATYRSPIQLLANRSKQLATELPVPLLTTTVHVGNLQHLATDCILCQGRRRLLPAMRRRRSEAPMRQEGAGWRQGNAAWRWWRRRWRTSDDRPPFRWLVCSAGRRRCQVCLVRFQAAARRIDDVF